MKRIASIHIYDCLDEISLNAQIREYKDYEQQESAVVITVHDCIRSEGLDDPRDWLRDALVALIEATG